MTSGTSFNEHWHDMQERYRDLRIQLQARGHSAGEAGLVHPSWQAAAAEIQAFLLGPPQSNPLAQRHLQGMMVRQGMTVSQEFELTHLTRCLPSNLAARLATFRDTHLGALPRECKALDCSVNTLGHLYYAAVSLERSQQVLGRNPGLILEFGSGYGNLARVFRHFVDGVSLILVDLPELLALQYLFIRETMPESVVRVHNDPKFTVAPGEINLVPVHFLHEMNCAPDLFISTFALSEAPGIVQRIVIERHFFNAAVSYISGQLHGAAPEHGWEHHDLLHHGLRAEFAVAEMRPFHVFQNGVQLYEALCSRQSSAAVRVSASSAQAQFSALARALVE